jgi:glycosyltransferase involved in cell wall biosynthesis
MTSDSFFVSVIIPVYNGEAFLKEAFESIRQQEYELLEIIIVDDGSTDKTKEIAASFEKEVRYIYQPNSGLPATRNRGVKMARGDVIAFLDVDDLWSKDKIRLQIALLRNSPSAEIVLGYTQIMTLTGIIDGIHVFKEWGAPVLAMSVGGAVFRKSVFDKIGLFDEIQRYCDDWDWFMRAREFNIEMVVHKEVVQLYRRHDQNMTNQQSLGNQYFIRMLKKSLDRRRQENCGQAESLPRLSCVGEESAGRLSASEEEQTKD